MDKYVKYIVLSIFFIAFSSINVFAEDNEIAGGFTIEGVPNDHQIDKNVGYFYLKENPGERDHIKIKLINSSEKEKTLKLKVVDANTNSNGVIDYTGSLANSHLLKNPLTNFLNFNTQEVKVPARETKLVSANLLVPKNSFPGVIVGGIVVSENNNENSNNKKDSISNEYSYTIGVILTNENKIELFKNISVELRSVYPTLFTGKKVVQANILNPNPYIFSKAEVKGAIYNEDGKTKIKENYLNNVSIAPYSVLPFQIDWQKDDLKPGTYIFKGSVKTEENTWDFEKKFEIKNTEAKKINEESVFKVVLPIWFIYSGYFVILINIIGSFYIIIRKVKKQGRK